MSDTKQTFPVLHYARYLGPGGNEVYSYEDFCGSCGQHLAHPYAFPKTADALEGDGDWWDREDERELIYFSSCPWCGVAFDDEWWKSQPIQNERVIDHYQNPGTHKGDTHQFVGDGPDCINGHWLATTGTEICWCDPEIEPGIMGCVIRHQDKRFEDVMALRRELEQDVDADDSNDDYDW